MLKISSKGLEEYKDDYYNEIEENIRSNIEKSNSCSNELKDYLNTNLKTILIGNFYSLRKVIKKIEKSFLRRNNTRDNTIKTLKEIFDYTILYNNNLRHTILNKIGVNVCPYCGRQFVSSYDDKSSAEIDHFYSKDKYPYLALSLFNFVPSCHLCNSILKKNHDFFKKKHLYPYIKGFEEKARFDIDNSVLITDIINGSADAKLIIDYDKKNKKIKHNINTFKLEALYQNHSKDVRELFKLIQIYNSSYLECTAKTLLDDKPSGQMLAQKAIELMNIVFKEKGNDEILSKLHNDILNKYWRHDLD